MKTGTRTRVMKFTISLPADLLAWGEEERANVQLSRSAFVANLYRRYHDELDMERRIARYKAAYSSPPETYEERALTKMSMELLAAEPRTGDAELAESLSGCTSRVK